jgi:hypothetical protein
MTVVNVSPQALDPQPPLHPPQEATEVRFTPAADVIQFDTPVTIPDPNEVRQDGSDAATAISTGAAEDERAEDRAEQAAEPMQPPAQQRPTIAVLEFADNLGSYPMRLQKISIGRHTDNDIRIEDVTVSRHHAIVSLAPNGGFEIHNLTSGRSERNPVLVNGVERDQATLADGDEVTIGSVRFRFLIGQAPAV